ncbi:rhoptry neck protein 2 [Babesia caballi]|uniref:Rhoptry neck protein 2 n=1 Tax=Babesia caballi TaxID=5871 RepID=A0AAV4LVF0_BABCB|nr:rhoptry neck protein 2 [Babesia caballi]
MVAIALGAIAVVAHWDVYAYRGVEGQVVDANHGSAVALDPAEIAKLRFLNAMKKPAKKEEASTPAAQRPTNQEIAIEPPVAEQAVNAGMPMQQARQTINNNSVILDNAFPHDGLGEKDNESSRANAAMQNGVLAYDNPTTQGGVSEHANGASQDNVFAHDNELMQGMSDLPLEEQAAVTNEDNLAVLEQSVGITGFMQPFIDSLSDELRVQLLTQNTSNFVEVYRKYARKLETLERQAYRRLVKLVEEKADAIGFVDFSERQRGNLLPEVNKEAMKVAGLTSLLQVGEEVTRLPPVTRSRAAPVARPATNKQAPQGKVDQNNSAENRARFAPKLWTKNTKVLETILIKVLYLLGGDTQTSELTQRLNNMAMALGYKPSATVNNGNAEKVERNSTVAMNMGMELFWVCGNNPFLLGHLATNMLAYTEYNLFFTGSHGRPFYTWLDLVKSGNIDMLDRMCGTKRGPKYKRGSDGSITVNKNRKRKDDPELSPDGIFLCNILEVLLVSIDASIDAMGQLLSQHGVPYEHHVGAIANGRRMQAVLCSDPRESAIVVRCDFESSMLNTTKIFQGKSKDEGEELLRRLHDAFDLFKLLSDVSLDGEIPTTWMRMISDPRKYATVFEYAIKYDNRMFSGKFKSWESGYHGAEKKVIRGLENSNLDLRTALSMLAGQDAKPQSASKVALKRAFLYMSASGIKTWVSGNLESLQDRFGFSPSVTLAGNLAPYFRQIAQNTSGGLSHIFLYHTLTSMTPAYHFQRSLNSFRGGNLLYNIVESSNMFIPASLKRGIKWLLKGGLAKEFRREKAKHTLLQLLPVELLRKAISAITFVTHSLADMQINQNAPVWGRGMMSAKDRQDKHMVNGGYVNHVDTIIKEWSDEGYTDSIAKKVKQGEDLSKEDLQKANMHNIVHTESLKWDKHLNARILEGYNAFLDLPSIKKLDGRHSLLYEIVKDTRDNLEQNLGDTIFFGRVVPPPVYNNKWKRLLQRVTKVAKIIFNKSLQNVEHAVWFGVKFNYKHIVEVVEELDKISKLISSTESYNLQEAFAHIIDDAVAVVSNEEFRRPPGTQENFGIPSINPLYTRMTPDERKVEFQQGMCGQHCGAIWRALLAFTMNTMRSPASIKTFEKTLSQNNTLKDMEKPEFVNSMRFILKGDAMLHMYDSMLPKKMKRELRAIKYGKAFYFANIMKMASNLLGILGYRYTANMLRIQAPYFGNFVVQWDRERENSRSKAIFSYLSIGTMATYSIMQCAEITQHAADVGQGPVESCFMLIKPPRMHCVVQPVQNIVKSAMTVGIQDALSVTVMAVIGPYFFLPMAAVSSWQILKHHFKVIHRLDMAVSITFKRMWSKISSSSIAKKLTSWFTKRREHRKEIEAKGLLAMKNQSPASKESATGAVAVADEMLKADDNFSYTNFT